MNTDKKYKLTIKSYDGSFVKEIGIVTTGREAERIERGALINMNREEYYVDREAV